MLLVLAALGAARAASAQPSRAEETLRFAEQLYSERDFYRAIGEYKRFAFQSPGSPLLGWARLRIGQSYLEGGRAEAAWTVFDAIAADSADARLRSWARLASARSLYRAGRLRQSLAALARSRSALASDAQLSGTAAYLQGCVHLRLDEIAAARSRFASIWAGHPLAGRAWRILDGIEGFDDLPSKSPWLAGTLSIVPGLGHVYLEQYSIGLTAAAWNGLFAFATYDAFRRGSRGVGILLAAMELLWYSGTIYGAVNGAERYKRDARQNLLDAIEQQAELDVPFPDDGAVHLILVQGLY